MDGSNIEKLRDELTRLMREHIESMRQQTFLGISPEDVQAEKRRLNRIREVSAEFLEALKRISG
jgi:hypothetical protein